MSKPIVAIIGRPNVVNQLYSMPWQDSRFLLSRIRRVTRDRI